MDIRRTGLLALTAGVLVANGQSTNPADLAPGKILIMQGDAPDPVFAHSVIVLAHYDRTGALGFMIHRRSNVPVRKALAGLPGADKRTDSLYVGGPVELDGVLALLRSGKPPEGGSSVTGNLYLLSSQRSIETALTGGAKEADSRIFLGYTGWGPGQLEREVKLNAWYIFDYDERLVFDEHPETLWERLIEKTGLLKVFYPFRRARGLISKPMAVSLRPEGLWHAG